MEYQKNELQITSWRLWDNLIMPQELFNHTVIVNYINFLNYDMLNSWSLVETKTT